MHARTFSDDIPSILDFASAATWDRCMEQALRPSTSSVAVVIPAINCIVPPALPSGFLDAYSTTVRIT